MTGGQTAARVRPVRQPAGERDRVARAVAALRAWHVDNVDQAAALLASWSRRGELSAAERREVVARFARRPVDRPAGAAECPPGLAPVVGPSAGATGG